ncbi:hypothetical protein [Algibacter sp. R77976]|uniref:hypothetical protein n=1 Tax=Algibacter sp. R77976 TaxID=3093873 RepID=UPI0037CB02B5
MRRIYFYCCFILISNLAISQSKSSNSNFKKIIETTTYNVTYSDGKTHVFTSEINEYNYNIDGQKLFSVRKTFHNREPYKTVKTTFFYNEENNIDYTNSYITTDSINYKTNYYYLNKKLKKISARYNISEKQTKYNEEYFYNKDNILVKSNYILTEKYPDSYIGERHLNAEYVYNKKGKIIESNWTKSDSSYKYNKVKYFRNKKGFITKEKEFNKNNRLVKTTSFKYILDEKNNWVIRKYYEKKSLVKSIYREIEYFK